MRFDAMCAVGVSADVVEVTEGVATTTVANGWFGRPREVEVDADRLHRVLHKVLVEIARPPA